MRWMLVVLSLLAFSQLSLAEDSWARSNRDGSWCRRLSPTYIMRDQGMCGSSRAVFCNVVVDCWAYGSTGWFKTTTGLVSCRANNATLQITPPSPASSSKSDTAPASMSPPVSTNLSCPGFQQCADDPNPQQEFASRISQWDLGSDYNYYYPAAYSATTH